MNRPVVSLAHSQTQQLRRGEGTTALHLVAVDVLEPLGLLQHQQVAGSNLHPGTDAGIPLQQHHLVPWGDLMSARC